MKKRAEFQISAYIVSLLLFAVVITIGLNFISDFRNEDSSFMSQNEYKSFNSSFNQMNNIKNQASNIQTNITSADPDLGVYGVVGGLVNSAWSSLKLTFNSFSFMENMLKSTAYYLNIPEEIVAVFYIIITVLIGFAIYKLIFAVGDI